MKLSSERKKELQDQYKLMKTDMGIFAVINEIDSKYFLESTKNLKAKINRTRFQLNADSHPNRELQKDWKTAANEFEIRILEKLEYDEDDSKTDYSDELEILKKLWVEKLAGENIQLY